MKRLLLLLAATAAIVLGGVAPAHADTSDFTFSSFDAHYTLSRDADGYAQLTTVETLVARFPDYDQNHGIVRDLVDSYNRHPIDLDVQSVTDAAGAPIDYDTSSDNGYLELKIGDGDSYVHGEQTYVITYTQKYVTAYFSDSNDDEFYWDTNGTAWEQPFDSVTATVSVAADLVPALTGDVSSYGGAEGTNDVPTSHSADGATFQFSADQRLAPGENLTLVIGFAPHTFADRPTGFFAAPWPTLSLVFAILAVVALALAIALRVTRLADAKGRGIVVAEYVAPKGVSLPLSATILGRTAKVTSAMIISLAVSGALRISEVPGGRKPTYRLDYLSTDGLDPDSLEFMHALFGPTFETGETHSLSSNDASAARQIAQLVTRVTRDAKRLGYRKPLPGWRIFLVGLLAVLSFAFSGVFALMSLADDYGGSVPLVFVAAALLCVLVTIAIMVRSPLSDTGVALRDYLKGLKVYIDLAEEDRLRFLQSPQGAERVPIATDDTASLVKLNEKLLPYAVLFGNEQEWSKTLGKYYEQTGTQPNWYYGSSAFNAVYFASVIGTINTTAASSFVVPSSSSSGGSGGGGFSGGGGGGGGGSGW